MKLLILRHGETEWTISGRHTGWSDIDLTRNGRAEAQSQAPVLSSMLGGSDPLVFVSPRLRTRHTADLALPGQEFIVEPLIAEFDYGDYEGLTHDEVKAITPGWEIWTDGCPGGETPEQVADRADRFLAMITDADRVDPGRPTVAITHGHMSRALVVRALDQRITAATLLDSATASLSMVTTVRDKPVLGLWNLAPRTVPSVRYED